MATNLLVSSTPAASLRSDPQFSLHRIGYVPATRRPDFPAPLSSRLTLRPAPPLSVLRAASSTAVEVDGTAAATKPSKSLPFRVGHGFDLHRLEPSYPLIIGGIDIPHDRGCEAHSDGNCSSFFIFRKIRLRS